MYFRNYGLRMTWLSQFLKSTVSKGSSTGNMKNGPKHYFNLNQSTFSISMDPCQSN